MSREIFVSYTQNDKQIAFALVKFLEKYKANCFIAPRNIDPGIPYARALVRGMNECETAIVVCSRATNESEHVLNEIETLVSNKKTIIPFIIEEFEFAPDLKYYLGRKQFILAYDGDAKNHFGKVLDALGIIPEEESAAEIEEVELTNTKTVFEYIPERGIMVNPEDHQRNVSFRSDTLINLFGGIYQDVAKEVTPEAAERIFYNAGYKAGVNFARRLNDQWSLSDADISGKLRKWCQFDSQVGWGKFKVDIDIDEEMGTLDGTLVISENFMVDKSSKCHTCSFVKGYCAAVMSVLIEGVDVELDCIGCPLKNRFKSECKFKIRMVDEVV